jgi:hypothetical protein
MVSCGREIVEQHSNHNLLEQSQVNICVVLTHVPFLWHLYEGSMIDCVKNENAYMMPGSNAQVQISPPIYSCLQKCPCDQDDERYEKDCGWAIQCALLHN